jgi:hypothetical protein
MKLYAEPNKGAERFWDVDFQLTDQVVAFDPEQHLDRTGRKRLARKARGRPYLARKGIATIAWKSVEAREQCRGYEQGFRRGNRNRWTAARKYAEKIRCGERPPAGPV